VLAVRVSDALQLSTLTSLLSETASLTPDKIAIKVKNTEITYEALNRRVNALAFKIYESGIKENEIVALYLERSVDMIIAMLSCLKTGCAFSPMNLNAPLERLKYLLADSGVTKVITYPSIFPIVAGVDLIVPTDDVSPVVRFAKENFDPKRNAYLLYTSGSTGLPKGVLIQYNSMMSLFTSLTAQIGFSSSDVIPLMFPWLSYCTH